MPPRQEADVDRRMDVASRAAREAGALLRSMLGTEMDIRSKDVRTNLVTEADTKSEALIRSILADAFRGEAFLGEETGSSGDASRGRWIVDPLDGTMNYVHGVPNYAVSIALEQRGQLLVGTVLDPVNGECFSAARDQGAWLNGRRLRVSAANELSQALVAASFPARVERNDREIADFIEVTVRAQGTRRMGSSALNLCYVAAGRFDGYWSTSTKTWDIAAGALMILEAGGVISHYGGGPLDLARPQFIAAATPKLHNELRGLLHRTG